MRSDFARPNRVPAELDEGNAYLPCGTGSHPNRFRKSPGAVSFFICELLHSFPEAALLTSRLLKKDRRP